MTEEPINIPNKCPVCASDYMSFVRHVPTTRTKRNLPLYYCMQCESFMNPTGENDIKDEELLLKQLQFHIDSIDRKVEFGDKLFKVLRKMYPKAQSVLEIGSGIGALLHAGKKYFPKVTGYDINEHACAFGRKKFGLDLRSEFWTPDATEPYDIYFSNHVFEHLEQPRQLFADMCSAAKETGGVFYVSMPMLNRNRWHYLLDPNPKKPGTPFFNNDAHVTHFSSKGLFMLARQCEATQIRTVPNGLPGYVIEFKPVFLPKFGLIRSIINFLDRLDNSSGKIWSLSPARHKPEDFRP